MPLFRHTVATLKLESAPDNRFTQTMLGHADNLDHAGVCPSEYWATEGHARQQRIRRDSSGIPARPTSMPAAAAYLRELVKGYEDAYCGPTAVIPNPSAGDASKMALSISVQGGAA